MSSVHPLKNFFFLQENMGFFGVAPLPPSHTQIPSEVYEDLVFLALQSMPLQFYCAVRIRRNPSWLSTFSRLAWEDIAANLQAFFFLMKKSLSPILKAAFCIWFGPAEAH